MKKSALSEEELQSRIVEELLEHEEEEERSRRSGSTGNPTMDRYIDDWLSPKKPRSDASDVCLMKDAMLPAAMTDDEQEILEQETECDGKDLEKYMIQLKSVDGDNFTKLENTLSSLDEEDEVEKTSISAER